jgi:hypothetical protein
LEDASGTGWATLTALQAFFAVPLRVDGSLTADTASGPDLDVYAAAVRARTGDALLTLTGGTAGLRAEGALEITGITAGTQAVFSTSVATAQLAPSLSQRLLDTRWRAERHGGRGPVSESAAVGRGRRNESEQPRAVSDALRAGSRRCQRRAQEHSADGARQALDANNSAGRAELQVLATGDWQTMAFNNQAGLAPLGIAANGSIASNYSFADLSDARIKTNLRAAELAAAFDGLQALW